jgi:hypothetical protein
MPSVRACTHVSHLDSPAEPGMLVVSMPSVRACTHVRHHTPFPDKETIPPVSMPSVRACTHVRAASIRPETKRVCKHKTPQPPEISKILSISGHVLGPGGCHKFNHVKHMGNPPKPDATRATFPPPWETAGGRGRNGVLAWAILRLPQGVMCLQVLCPEFFEIIGPILEPVLPPPSGRRSAWPDGPRRGVSLGTGVHFMAGAARGRLHPVPRR